MYLLLAIPGGFEWILIFLALGIFVVAPILAIVFYARSRFLKRQVDYLTSQNQALLAQISPS